MSNTIICESFKAEALPDGKFRLEIFPVSEASAPSPNRRLRVSDVFALVKKMTGKEVTAATVYRWARMKKNRLPSHKVVGSLFFVEDEVTRWLQGWTKAEGGLL